MRLRSVPRVRLSEFSPSRFGDRPAIVLDTASDWGALRSWGPDYLRSVAGEREVVVRETEGPPANIFQNLAEGGSIRFADYLDWVLETAADLGPIAGDGADVGEITRAVCASGFETSYYLDTKVAQLAPELLDDTPVPGWYPPPPVDMNFWCGVLGTSSGLHCDVTPNCNVQVIGRKHFRLFAPWQGRRVYRKGGVTHCRFDPNDPDYERFPRARRASGWECTLEPGEALYIPVGWYHQVTVVSPWAVNVNFFWRRPFPEGLAKPALWRFLLRRGRARLRARLAR